MANKAAMTQNTEAALQKVSASVSEQTKLVSKCYELYQAQMDRAAKLWMDSATTAMKESQKAAREWMDLGSQVAADAQKTFETGVKETTKLYKTAA